MRGVNGYKTAPGSTVLDKDLVKVGGRGRDVEFTLEDEADIRILEQGLRLYLEESQGWFAGQAVTVNVGRRMLNPKDLGGIRQVFEEEHRIAVSRFTCGTATLERWLSEEAGAPVVLESLHPAPCSVGETVPRREVPLLIKGNCRSGTAIHHEGDVIVRGDLNPGAHVTATGDIIVLGAIRGIAHAGANSVDDTEAVIIALSLRPIQLRLGRHVSVAPANQKNNSNSAHPEIAYVSGNSIVVGPFTGWSRWIEERNLS